MEGGLEGCNWGPYTYYTHGEGPEAKEKISSRTSPISLMFIKDKCQPYLILFAVVIKAGGAAWLSNPSWILKRESGFFVKYQCPYLGQGQQLGTQLVHSWLVRRGSVTLILPVAAAVRASLKAVQAAKTSPASLSWTSLCMLPIAAFCYTLIQCRDFSKS